MYQDMVDLLYKGVEKNRGYVQQTEKVQGCNWFGEIKKRRILLVKGGRERGELLQTNLWIEYKRERCLDKRCRPALSTVCANSPLLRSTHCLKKQCRENGKLIDLAIFYSNLRAGN